MIFKPVLSLYWHRKQYVLPHRQQQPAGTSVGWKPVVLPVSPPRPHLLKALPLIRAFMWAFLNWGSDFLPSAFIFMASRTHYVYLGILGPCSHVVTSRGFRDPIGKNHMKWPTWERARMRIAIRSLKTTPGEAVSTLLITDVWTETWSLSALTTARLLFSLLPCKQK